MNVKMGITASVMWILQVRTRVNAAHAICGLLQEAAKCLLVNVSAKLTLLVKIAISVRGATTPTQTALHANVL